MPRTKKLVAQKSAVPARRPLSGFRRVVVMVISPAQEGLKARVVRRDPSVYGRRHEMELGHFPAVDRQ